MEWKFVGTKNDGNHLNDRTHIHTRTVLVRTSQNPAIESAHPILIKCKTRVKLHLKH